MQLTRGSQVVAATALATLTFIGAHVAAIGQQPAAGGAGGRQGRAGGAGQGGRQGGGRGLTFPQFQRPVADPAVLARGKGLYEANCAACHGIDLRGGQQGGPNLLRSQVVLTDKAGEAIMTVVQSGRPNPPVGVPPMPAFQQLQPDAIGAIAEYIHSVMAMGGNQGRPPVGETVPAESVLVGNAAAGQAYFAATCSSCHSVTGDLKGIAARAADARELQNMWVSGGGGGGRGGRGGGGGQTRPVTVTVTTASGQKVDGQLVRIDDFIVTLTQADGTRRAIQRRGDDPKIDIHDPLEPHQKLILVLADKDMHNVTAYLATIK